MEGFLFGLAVGLIVGWNILPQPLWIERLYGRVRSRVRD